MPNDEPDDVLFFKSYNAACAIIAPDIHFDGHVWWPPTGAGLLAVIEMAYRARRGDQVAIALLTAFKIKVMSGNDRQYWPMTETDKLNEEVRKWDSGEWKPTDPGWQDAPEAIPNKEKKHA